MAILLKVKWVDQADQPEPHQCIRHIGGDSKGLQWKHTHAQAIESIENGLFAYYVERNERALRLEVGQTTDGRKYLTVQADGGRPQLLLNCRGEAPEPHRTP